VRSPAGGRDPLLRQRSPLQTAPPKVFPHEHGARARVRVARSVLAGVLAQDGFVGLPLRRSVHVATAGLPGKRIFPEDLAPS